MKKQDLIIKLNGSIHFQENKSDFKNLDKEIFYRLNESRHEIIDEICHRISQKFDEQVEFDLHFERGSIIITGIAVIKWISIIGGVFSFIDYASRTIKKIVSRVLEEWIRQNGPKPINPRIIISASPNSLDFQESEINAKEHKDDKAENKKSSVINPFTLKTILITITLVNIIIFLGGSVQGLFTVDSLRDQYAQSKEDLRELKSDLKARSNEIEVNQKRAKLELENLPFNLERKYAGPIEVKRDSLLIELNRISGTIKILNEEIESQKELAKAKINLIPLEFKEEFSKPLNQSKDSIKNALISVNKSILELNEDLNKQIGFYNDSTMTLVKLLKDSKGDKSIEISFRDLNWGIILSIGFSLINLSLIFVLFRIKKKK